MAGPSERREREKKELRIKILDAARELFAQQGYEAVTMRKISERIEYSPTVIYQFFADKNALIADLCRHDFLAFGERFLEFAAVADPVERLRRISRVYASFAAEYPQHYRLMFMTRQPDGAQAQANPNDPAENAYVFLRMTVAQAMAEGRIREAFTDIDLLAQTLWAGVHGVISLEIAKGHEKRWVDWRPPRERLELMTEALIGHFVKDGAPQDTEQGKA
jgi:AcrR family transcriptional regulator